MTARYGGQRGSQRERRRLIMVARARLGDARFAEFITDLWSENGTTIEANNLPALAEVWAARALQITTAA